ncbi:MAG: ABC transporter permease [Eubacterium sp.]|nr:ABC transporter permease [Eubacterium sp.]
MTEFINESLKNPEYWAEINKIVTPEIGSTLYMVFFSSLFSIIIGSVLGIILYVTQKDNILENTPINSVIGTIVNIGRSIPFVILMIAVFPLARFIVGTSIGSTASIVPLTVAATPFVARMIENSLNELDRGVIEASVSMGANEAEIITKVMLPEAAPSIISSITITIINIIGYSAMAGTIGGGGLGDGCIRYGYQRSRTDILIYSVIIMIVMVQIIQCIGNVFSKHFDKR